MPDTVLAPFSDDGKSPSASLINSMNYPERLRAFAATFERQDRSLGRAYALGELRQSLNHLSNEALQESRHLRENHHA